MEVKLNTKLKDYGERNGFHFFNDTVMVSIQDKKSFIQSTGIDIGKPNKYFNIKYYVEYKYENGLYYFKLYNRDKLIYAEAKFSTLKKVYNPINIDDVNIKGNATKPLLFNFINKGFKAIVKQSREIIDIKLKK